MRWRLIRRRVPSLSMTVVGDLAQTSSAAGATSWAQALDPIASGRWQVRELTVNYRTPAMIMRPAVAMLRAAGMPGLDEPESAREGDWPPVAIQLTRHSGDGGWIGELCSAVISALASDDNALSGGLFAVVLPRSLRAEAGELITQALKDPASEAARIGPDRVSVLGVDEVKGLEFDAVVVAEPGLIMAESSRGANDLYVALTRPTQRLTVVHSDPLPPGLDVLSGRP